MELAKSGIRINAITPGWIDVERNYQEIRNYDPKTAGTIIPVGRIGHVSDTVKAAIYLASDESIFVIGQTITVYDGTSAKMALDFEKLPFG